MGSLTRAHLLPRGQHDSTDQTVRAMGDGVTHPGAGRTGAALRAVFIRWRTGPAVHVRVAAGAPPVGPVPRGALVSASDSLLGVDHRVAPSLPSPPGGRHSRAHLAVVRHGPGPQHHSPWRASTTLSGATGLALTEDRTERPDRGGHPQPERGRSPGSNGARLAARKQAGPPRLSEPRSPGARAASGQRSRRLSAA